MDEKIDTKKTNTRKFILYFVLILSIFISSLSGVMAKFAAQNEFLSFKFILFYAIELVILFIYAIIWQQIIKHLNLSIAYAFKSTALIWTLVWGALIFSESLSVTKILGVAVVIVGIIIVNIRK